MLQTLEGEDAIAKNREVMGATNPAIRAVAAYVWTSPNPEYWPAASLGV
jgi:hypothetical protein